MRAEIEKKNKSAKYDKSYEYKYRAWEFLSKLEFDRYMEFEKTIITLSSAFLAFSLAFLGLIVKVTPEGVILPPFNSLGLLVLSWIFFPLSIIAILISFITNASAIRNMIKENEDRFENVEDFSKSRFWGNIADFLYIVSTLSFIGGITCLIIFCYKNLDKF